MKKSTSISNILQSVIPKEKILLLLQELEYIDVARKFTVYDLFLFLAEASFQQWAEYRDGEARMGLGGLRPVDHSTLSKKAKDVPFELFKQLLHLMISCCNRSTRRHLGIPKALLLVDSTKITVGKERLPWAPLKGERAGIKLHVSLVADEGRLHKVIETTGNSHDFKSSPDVIDKRFIVVADRAYGSHKRFDDYLEQRQSFVIRLRDNTHFQDPLPRERFEPFTGTLERDFTCQLGKNARLSKHRFRVVILKDPQGNPVILATNLHWHSAERLLYVLLKFLFDEGNAVVHWSAKLTFADFDRLFTLRRLPVEWNAFLLNDLTFP